MLIQQSQKKTFEISIIFFSTVSNISCFIPHSYPFLDIIHKFSLIIPCSPYILTVYTVASRFFFQRKLHLDVVVHVQVLSFFKSFFILIYYHYLFFSILCCCCCIQYLTTSGQGFVISFLLISDH